MRRHAWECNPTVFCVDFETPHAPELASLNTVHLRYANLACQVPKFMLQHGAFIEAAPMNWKGTDTIIFTDADAYLQRPFSFTEENLVLELGEVGIGFNKVAHTQTLADEANCLAPQVPPARIEQCFPGYRSLLCRNTGFVVASFLTWQALYVIFKEFAARGRECFGIYAWVQWVLCYIVQRPASGFKLIDVPLSMHAHGHVGLHEGVHKDGDLWKHNEQVIAFAHVL